MRIITINPNTGAIESVVQLRKEKIQQYLFTIHILSIDTYGRLVLRKITVFREVEIILSEEISPIMAYLDRQANYFLG